MAKNTILPLVVAFCLSACASASTSTPPPTGPTVPLGFRVTLYAEDLRGPTALAFGPGGALYATQLNGGENEGRGQVVAIDKAGATPRVLLDGLPKPTGLAWHGDALFIATGRDVLQTRLGADGRLEAPASVVRDLPFNTRSEGQIDLLPDGRLLFESSGLVDNGASGRLLTLVPGEQPEVLATGLKGAYAHAVDPDSGQIYTTEIGDDPVDGQAPPEEINAVTAGGDYGWPRCYGARLPVAERGGATAACAATLPPLITFAPHATPTGLEFYAGDDFPPQYRNALYVALWQGNPPSVQCVRLRSEGGTTVGEATPFVTGLKQPIDVLRDPQGGLLVLDFATGAVYRIEAVRP